MGRTAGIKFLRSEQFMKKTVLQKNKKHHRGLGRSDTFDAWVLMLPMVIILYLFVWRPTVLGGYWSFFKMN